MAITAKELAKKLSLSATAVSMALNNKPGVSNATRDEVIKAAEAYGYDFTRLAQKIIMREIFTASSTVRTTPF